MKHLFIPKALTVALIAASILSAQAEEAAKPEGRISTDLTKVLGGSKVNLDWNISYPVINLTDKVDTQVTVKFITLAIGPRWTVKFGTTIDGKYTQFYNGVSEEHSNYKLEPGAVVASTFKSHNTPIGFRARHARTQISTSGGWVDSNDPAMADQIIRLVDGDQVPSVAPVAGQRSVADILQPYSKDGYINIGNNQEIYIFELYTANKNHFGFDLQDLVLLVSYEQVDVTE